MFVVAKNSSCLLWWWRGPTFFSSSPSTTTKRERRKCSGETKLAASFCALLEKERERGPVCVCASLPRPGFSTRSGICENRKRQRGSDKLEKSAPDFTGGCNWDESYAIPIDSLGRNKEWVMAVRLVRRGAPWMKEQPPTACMKWTELDSHA